LEINVFGRSPARLVDQACRATRKPSIAPSKLKNMTAISTASNTDSDAIKGNIRV